MNRVRQSRPVLKWVLPVLGLVLASCSAPSQSILPTRAVVADSSLPPVKNFSPSAATPPSRSNHDMTRDFLDLSFQLESGRNLPRLTRFEGPITVRLEGPITATTQQDLNHLLARLRSEARIDIQRITSGTANITIHAVPRRSIRRTLPNAACFVVPNVTSLSDFRSASTGSRIDWTKLESREQISIFLSFDTSPQDIRDCLHEELAQALGPLNDLFRLHDSVFNDDNFHSVLTGFDMLMLRAYYDPALQNGMTRSEVAARLPKILARLNPAGETRANRDLQADPKGWKELIITSLGATGSTARLNSARQAVALAQGLGLRDHRLALSHYVMGRQYRMQDLDRARIHFEEAERLFALNAPQGPQQLRASLRLAYFDIADGQPEAALARLEDAIPLARRHQNAEQLATALMLQSEALFMLERTDAARQARLDSLGWARYGLGPDWAVQARMREIASLKPKLERR